MEFAIRFSFGLTALLIGLSYGGVIKNIKWDYSCSGAKLHELRFSDCNRFPCIIKRGKNYTIDAEFSMEKDVVNPNVICGTIYLGRQFDLTGYGGCNTLTNGTCPTTANTIYQSSTTFNIPYYVPPISYTVACRLEDDEGNRMLCGTGSGRVI